METAPKRRRDRVREEFQPLFEAHCQKTEGRRPGIRMEELRRAREAKELAQTKKQQR